MSKISSLQFSLGRSGTFLNIKFSLRKYSSRCKTFFPFPCLIVLVAYQFLSLERPVKKTATCCSPCSFAHLILDEDICEAISNSDTVFLNTWTSVFRSCLKFSISSLSFLKLLSIFSPRELSVSMIAFRVTGESVLSSDVFMFTLLTRGSLASAVCGLLGLLDLFFLFLFPVYHVNYL